MESDDLILSFFWLRGRNQPVPRTAEEISARLGSMSTQGVGCICRELVFEGFLTADRPDPRTPFVYTPTPMGIGIARGLKQGF